MVSDSQPVLYLDVDGVLNALSRPLAEWSDMATHYIEVGPYNTEYKVHLSRQMGAALAGLDVEIRWATTWAEDANTHIASKVGLPSNLAVSCRPRLSDSPFKSIAIRAEVESERVPFIWIDDEAIREVDHWWAKELGIPHLFIEPNPRKGLTPFHIDAIADFLRNLD